MPRVTRCHAMTLWSVNVLSLSPLQCLTSSVPPFLRVLHSIESIAHLSCPAPVPFSTPTLLPASHHPSIHPSTLHDVIIQIHNTLSSLLVYCLCRVQTGSRQRAATAAAAAVDEGGTNEPTNPQTNKYCC